jgi:cytochrome c-type protein NapC
MLELIPGPLIAIVATLIGVLLAADFLFRPGRAKQGAGPLVAAIAFIAVPGLVLTVGAERHIGMSKKTEFCLSCHEMHPHGATLLNAETLAGKHFANRYVPREQACYTCHTEYTMYGGMSAKLKGLQHLLVHYRGGITDPIKTYDPYSNRECLHCHEGAASFDEAIGHGDELESFRSDKVSCLECHKPAHGVEAGEVTKAYDGEKQFELPKLESKDGAH